MSADKHTVQVPLYTAHFVRWLDDRPGELRYEIRIDPEDCGNEEGDFVITSFPLIASDDGSTLAVTDFMTALHLLSAPPSEIGFRNELEQLILEAFNKGRAFERSQLDRRLGDRDDERDPEWWEKQVSSPD